MSLSAARLVVRADASTQMGIGHIMRCLALAQAWQAQGGAVTFASAKSLPDALQSRLQSENMALRLLDIEPGSEDDARQTAALAQALGAAALVVDGYHFGGKYQHRLKNEGLKLLFIDDNGHAEHYYSDFVLNQNVYAHEEMYQNREPPTILLLGTRYALLRREFWQWRGFRREIPNVARKLLVTMGGADPENVTAKVLDALELADVDGLEVAVVVGGSNPHLPDLERRVSQSRHKIDLKQNVEDMPALMAWADAAVSAAGTTTWELAFMGVPMALIAVAENQLSIMQRTRAGIPLGWHGDLDTEATAEQVMDLLNSQLRRKELSNTGRRMMDGLGGERVARKLIYPALRLRRVYPSDCQIIWEWANDPVARAMSFSTEPIPWDVHVRWFDRKRKDSSCTFLMAETLDSSRVGQVRYDIEEREAVISINLAPEFRGRGYGEAMIALSIDSLMTPLDVIHAYIKPDNMASVRAFEKAGFVDEGMTTVKDSPARHYVYRRLPNVKTS